MYYKTEGIILSQKKIGEADKLLTIYTKERGKIFCIAKGARKPLSRKTGHIELGNWCKLYIAQGKNLDILTEAILIKNFGGNNNSEHKSNMIYHLLEIINILTVELQKNSTTFNLLKEALIDLNEHNDYKMTATVYKVKLLSSLGFFSTKNLKDSNVKKLLSILEYDNLIQIKVKVKLDDKAYRKLLLFLDNMIENIAERNIKTSKFVYE